MFARSQIDPAALAQANIRMHTRMTNKAANGDVAHKSNLSIRIDQYMNDRGINAAKLRDAVSKVLGKEIGSRAIRYLMKESPSERPTDVRGETIELLDAIAEVFGTTTDDLFVDPSTPLVPRRDTKSLPPAIPITDEFKLQVAMTGPKANFLKDALDLAFTAAINSQKNY